MNLEELRKEISTGDEELIRLFLRRMELSKEVALYKKEQGLPVLDKSRERQVLHHMCSMAPDEMKSYVKMLGQSLFHLSKTYQSTYLHRGSDLARRITAAAQTTAKQFPKGSVVACQGIEGAYSQLAADRLFGTSGEIMYFKEFESVFTAVEKGLCQYGILPVENSSFGTVYSVYDLMHQHRFSIVRSLKMHIGHCLLGKEGAEEKEIREIFSHEQALGQCSEFLRRHKGVKVTICENTAVAAEMVARSSRGDVAALSSPNCASLYGLSVLNRAVLNNDNNYTRFICISKNLEIYPGASRMSLILTVPHEVGSLASVLSRFQALDINLSKLESRPVAGTDFQFLFYFDVEVSPYDQEALAMLSALEQQSEVFQFLGSYQEV